MKQLMQPQSSPFQRAHGVWVLDRQQALPDEILIAAAQDREAVVRVHAMRVLAERDSLTAEQRELALTGLKDSDAFVQRAAAQALGNQPAVANLRPLLDLRAAVPGDDTHLLHAVRMAIRDQLRPEKNLAKVMGMEWDSREIVALADVCLSLRNRTAAAFLLANLKQLPKGDRLASYIRHIARHGADSSVDSLVSFARKEYGKNAPAQAMLLRAIHQGTQERGGRLTQSAQQWADQLCQRLLTSANAGEVLAGVELAQQLRLPSAAEELSKIVAAEQRPDEPRGKAAAALAAIAPAEHIDTLAKVLVSGREEEALRKMVADALASTNQPAAQAALIQSLTSASAPLQVHIARALAGSQQGAEQLLKAVQEGKASARLLQEREVEQRLRQANPPHVSERLLNLTKGLPPASAALQELLHKRRDGFTRSQPNPKQGAMLFQKNCAACHQINNQGGKIAPQLDGIGVRGPERLLEDVLDPNRNVDQAFRATTLVLKNGQVFTGLLLREEGEILILADTQGKEQRYARGDVEERIVNQLSPMPANFAEQLPERDLYDLLAYLLEQQQAREVKKAER